VLEDCFVAQVEILVVIYVKLFINLLGLGKPLL
jgi:hypothetical protein